MVAPSTTSVAPAAVETVAVAWTVASSGKDPQNVTPKQISPEPEQASMKISPISEIDE
jgi:hypothetical protein